MDIADYVIMPGVDYMAACDAVREKTGKTDDIKSGDLAAEVQSITPKLQEKSLSANYTERTITPDEGYDGLSKVTLNTATVYLVGNTDANVKYLSADGSSITQRPFSPVTNPVSARAQIKVLTETMLVVTATPQTTFPSITVSPSMSYELLSNLGNKCIWLVFVGGSGSITVTA